MTFVIFDLKRSCLLIEPNEVLQTPRYTSSPFCIREKSVEEVGDRILPNCIGIMSVVVLPMSIKKQFLSIFDKVSAVAYQLDEAISL